MLHPILSGDNQGGAIFAATRSTNVVNPEIIPMATLMNRSHSVYLVTLRAYRTLRRWIKIKTGRRSREGSGGRNGGAVVLPVPGSPGINPVATRGCSAGFLAAVVLAIAWCPVAGAGISQDYGEFGDRILYPDTPLADLVIVGAPEYRHAMEAAADVIEEAGWARPEIRVSGLPDADLWERHLLLFGNFADNPLLETLYGKRLSPVDALYPGDGGFLLHPVCDPFARGRNVMVMGCSDEDGALKAVRALEELVDGDKGRIAWGIRSETDAGIQPIVVHADRALRRFENDLEALTDGDEVSSRDLFNILRDTSWLGEQYAYTGDKTYGEPFRELMVAFAEYANEMDAMPPGRLSGWSRLLYSPWRLLEPSPLFSEEERAAIAQCYYRTVEWDVNESYLKAFAANYEEGVIPKLRRNKYTFSAFGVFLGHEYFSTYFPGFDQEEAWADLVEKLFDRAGSIMGKDDVPDYFFHVPLNFLRYAAATGDEELMEKVIDIARLQTLFVDSLGGNTQLGDGTGFGHASVLYWGHSAILRAAAHYSGDPYFPGVIEKVANNDSGISTRDLTRPLYMFNSPMEGELPDKPRSVEKYPLDEAYYRDILNPHSRMYHGSHPRAGELNVPFEQSFFKLAWREGWDKTDQYLMLDGVNGAIHEHSDGNAIASFSSAGRLWLCGRSYTEKSENYQNGLMIVRDGSYSKKPYLAELGVFTDLPEMALTRTSKREYAGADWHRNIFWRKGDYLLVWDEVEILEEGDYVLQNYWPVVGQWELDGQSLRVVQENAGFVIENLDGSTMRAESRPAHADRTWGNYPYFVGGEPEMAKMRQIRTGERQPGERVRFVNVLAAREGESAPVVRGGRLWDTCVWLDTGEGRELAGVSGIIHRALEIDAELFFIGRKSGAFSGLETLRVEEWDLALDGAASLEIDWGSGEVSWSETGPQPGGVLNGEQLDPEALEAVLSGTRFQEALRAAAGRILASAGTPPLRPVDGTAASLEGRKVASAGAGVTAMTLVEEPAAGNERVVVAREQGAVAAFGLDGKVLWEAELGTRVNALQPFPGAGAGAVAAALWDRSVAVLDRDGDVLWRRELPVPRERAPGIACLALARGDGGREELAAGSGYLDIYRLDGSGEIVWRAEGYHRGVNAIAAGDFNGDGRDDVVVGMEWRNLQMQAGEEVKSIHRSSGWNWTAVQTAVFAGEDTAVSLGGSADGWFEFRRPEDRAGSWTVRLAGMIRDIAAVAGNEARGSGIYVGTGAFQLYALDLEGKIRWRKSLSDRIDRLAVTDKAIWAATADENIWKLMPDGSVVGRRALESPIVSLAPLSGYGGVAGVTAAGEVWYWEED